MAQNTTSAGEVAASHDVKARQSKTTMAWVDFLIKSISLMMLYMRAEREAD